MDLSESVGLTNAVAIKGVSLLSRGRARQELSRLLYLYEKNECRLPDPDDADLARRLLAHLSAEQDVTGSHSAQLSRIGLALTAVPAVFIVDYGPEVFVRALAFPND